MSEQKKIVIELDIEKFKTIMRGSKLLFGSEDDQDKDSVIEIVVSKDVPILSTLQEVIYQKASL